MGLETWWHVIGIDTSKNSNCNLHVTMTLSRIETITPIHLNVNFFWSIIHVNVTFSGRKCSFGAYWVCWQIHFFKRGTKKRLEALTSLSPMTKRRKLRLLTSLTCSFKNDSTSNDFTLWWRHCVLHGHASCFMALKLSYQLRHFVETKEGCPCVADGVVSFLLLQKYKQIMPRIPKEKDQVPFNHWTCPL